jgi:hypothetical protein
MIPNDKLITIINKMIDSRVQGADKYIHMDSTWLIFTEQKQWVIELTKDKTLWYNYNFFKKIFQYFKLDVIESQSVITKWVEDTIINGVRHTFHETLIKHLKVEDTIINGVRKTSIPNWVAQNDVEDTIKNGVMSTRIFAHNRIQPVEDTIKNGVKTTTPLKHGQPLIENAIQNGVKYTSWHEPILLGTKVENAIQNGVIETKGTTSPFTNYVEDAIENGVKDTKNRVNRDIRIVKDTIENGVKETHSGCDLLIDDYIEDTIQNGVKETQSSPLNRPFYVEDTIQNGVKETFEGIGTEGIHVEDVIQNGVRSTCFNRPFLFEWVEDTIKNGVKETKTPGEDGDIMGALDFMSDNNTNNLPQLIDNVIKNGVKRTEGGVLFDETKVDRIISEGVKETKGGGYLGSIEMKGKIVHQIESPKQNNEVEDVIEHGVKLTNSSLQIDGSCVVEDVIQNGIKETHDDVYHHKGRVDGVIKNGVKEVKELPDQSGELRGYGDYYHRQEDRTKPFTEYVDDVLIEGKKI